MAVRCRGRDPSLGQFKYGEYQDVCSTAQLQARTCFGNLTTVELFDLEADPWELRNIAASAAPRSHAGR